MVNILKIQQQQNQELLNKIADLEKKLADKEKDQEFKQLNNEEIRQGIISILINDYSASDMDAKAIDAVMYHCNQECGSKFCEWNPTEAICRNMIFYTYKFNHYGNLTGKLYSERNDARYHILINLIKLNSEESKGLFRKGISESKLEDTITTQRILENGYEEDGKSCYSYLDLRHLSLDELISSWNELTFKVKGIFDKVVKQNGENEEKIQQLEVKQEELEIRVEELEERVEIEVEMNLKALDKSKEGHDRRVFVENMKRDCTIIEQRIENDQLKKKLDAYEKKDKIKQIERLTKKAKTKVSERIQKLKEKVNLIKGDVKQKFDTYILHSN